MALNKWIWPAFCFALAATPAGAADVRLDSYRNPKSEAFRNFNQLYLDGVRSGLIAYNARIKSLGGQPTFCLPANLAMTTEQTEDIMLKSADKRAAKGDTLIALLLLSGLQDSVPCEKAGSQ